MEKDKRPAFVSIAILLCLWSPWTCHTCNAAIDCSASGQYSSTPIFVTPAVRPNILLLFSNDETQFRAGYNSKTYDDSREYYGYFDPKKEYTFTGGFFSPAGYLDHKNGHKHTVANRWSGNFLNWLTMSHADFTRKAFTGGRRQIDRSDKTVLLRGDIPNDASSDDSHVWSRTVPDASPYTPFKGEQTFTNVGTIVFRDINKNNTLDKGEEFFNVRVEVCTGSSAVQPEENCAYYENGNVWKPEGLLQKFKDKANFGLMTYKHTGNGEQGGVLRVNVHGIGDEINAADGTIQNLEGICGFINTFTGESWDPVAEMYYEAVRYFKGLKTPTAEFCENVTNPDNGFQVLCNRDGEKSSWTDPIISGCQKNFIIVVNDEYPSRDSDALPGSPWASSLTGGDDSIDVADLTRRLGDQEGITGNLVYAGNEHDTINHKNDCSNPLVLDNLGHVRGICPSEADSQGSFFIGGLAYFANITDLRDDFEGDQTITTYAIAFRSTPATDGYALPVPPLNPLYLAAKYGGFQDLNGNKQPDQGEWEGEAELPCMPSSFWNCKWPKNFAHAEEGKDLEDAITHFLTDILKGTSSGSAASVITSAESGEGQLFQATFEPSRSDGMEEVTWIGFLQSLWVDGNGNIREDSNKDGKLIPAEDKIINIRFDNATNTTVVDKYSDNDGNGVRDADECDPSSSSYRNCVASSEQLDLPLSSLKPVWEASEVLGKRDLVKDPRTIKTFADRNLDGKVSDGEFIDFTISGKGTIIPFLKVDSTDADNLIDYILGNEIQGWRSRTLGPQKFLLGDIVHSNPTAVDRPMDSFDVIYGDETYLAYYNKYKNRPTYVYTGANDGMLHAFYGGIFHPAEESQTAYIEVETGQSLGREVWAYIPNNLLPHLKWLTCPCYPHLYYVDLKPKIVDARIFSSEWNDATGVHPYGWGTILICGMGFGGAPITVRADFGSGRQATNSFKSAYFAMDVTDPSNPRLLWEKKFDRIGYTLSYPTVARIQNGTATPADVTFANQKWLIFLGNGPLDLNGDPGGSGYIYIVDLASGDTERILETPTPAGATEFVSSAAAVDLNLNYDVDVIYIGSVIKDQANSCGGRIYRISADTSGIKPDWDIGKWILSTLFDAEKPITAAPGLSEVGMSENENKIWVYFGTGRYLGPDDKSGTDQQSLYGIQDPCSFNYDTCTTTVQASNLRNVTDFKVYETGYVTGTGLPVNAQWEDLIKAFEGKDGFVVNLEQPPNGAPSERDLAKPAVAGGLVFFPTFTPDDNICAFSGVGRLYALYYKTGTSYKENTIGVDDKDTHKVKKIVLKKVSKSKDLGPGLPSQTAIHLGEGKKSKSVTQMSTSAVIDHSFNPAQKMKSGFVYWREME